MAFLLGKLTISMAMFDSKLLNYQRVTIFFYMCSGFLQRTPLNLHQSNENQKNWGDNTQILLPNKAHMSETNDTDVIQHGNSIESPLVDEETANKTSSGEDLPGHALIGLFPQVYF